MDIISSSGKGTALAEELGGLGAPARTNRTTTSSAWSTKRMARWGRIDVLVNSAGHGLRAAILEMTDEDWHKGLDVYLMNVIRADATRRADHAGAERLGRSSTSRQLRLSSPSPVFPTSGVFRAGLAAFTKLFADNYAPDNVRMNNVLPGFIDSLPATEERLRSYPDATIWPERGDRRDDRVPRLGGCWLHHGPEHPRRRRG